MRLSTNISTGANHGADSSSAVPLLLMEGGVKLVENPEHVIEEIQMRATVVSSILEGILSEPHDHPDWGLND